ncbi:MAG: hypothetical protein JSV40_02445, partial [Deltaproteobacteria bacterium]
MPDRKRFNRVFCSEGNSRDYCYFTQLLTTEASGYRFFTHGNANLMAYATATSVADRTHLTGIAGIEKGPRGP